MIDQAVRKAVIAQYLQGVSRDRIAADNNVSAGSVSNIIDDFKSGVQDSDFSSVREFAIHCKKEGADLRDLPSALRIKNHYNSLTQLGTNVSEEQVEAYIANLASSPDPAKLIEAAAQISESDVPLERLEEHVKALKAEKEMLQREVDEKRATLDGLDVDVESRRKLLEEYAEMKAEMRRYGIAIGPEDPKRFSRLTQTLQRGNYDCSKILSEFAVIEDTKRLRQEVDRDRQNLEGRFEEVRETLPLADQLLRAGITIGEVLAFHSAVYEKADMERIPLDTAAYKIVEDIRDYSQLGLLKKEQDRLQQQIFMSNMILASRQQTFASLMRLQALGVSDVEIKNMAQLIAGTANGNTNNGWPT